MSPKTNHKTGESVCCKNQAVASSWHKVEPLQLMTWRRFSMRRSDVKQEENKHSPCAVACVLLSLCCGSNIESQLRHLTAHALKHGQKLRGGAQTLAMPLSVQEAWHHLCELGAAQWASALTGHYTHTQIILFFHIVSDLELGNLQMIMEMKPTVSLLCSVFHI